MTVSTEIRKALEDLRRVGAIPAAVEDSKAEDIVLMYPSSLATLDELGSLQTVRIVGAGDIDYTVLSRLPVLHVMTIEHSALDSLDGVVAPELRAAMIGRNRVRSLEPLESISGLQMLDISGNPVDEESAAWAEARRAHGLVLVIDDPGVRDLNRRLVDAHPGIACFGTEGSCTLTANGSEHSSAPDRISVPTTATDIDARIGDDAAMAALLDSQWP